MINNRIADLQMQLEELKGIKRSSGDRHPPQVSFIHRMQINHNKDFLYGFHNLCTAIADILKEGLEYIEDTASSRASKEDLESWENRILYKVEDVSKKLEENLQRYLDVTVNHLTLEEVEDVAADVCKNVMFLWEYAKDTIFPVIDQDHMSRKAYNYMKAIEENMNSIQQIIYSKSMSKIPPIELVRQLVYMLKGMKRGEPANFTIQSGPLSPDALKVLEEEANMILDSRGQHATIKNSNRGQFVTVNVSNYRPI